MWFGPIAPRGVARRRISSHPTRRLRARPPAAQHRPEAPSVDDAVAVEVANDFSIRRHRAQDISTGFLARAHDVNNPQARNAWRHGRTGWPPTPSAVAAQRQASPVRPSFETKGTGDMVPLRGAAPDHPYHPRLRSAHDSPLAWSSSLGSPPTHVVAHQRHGSIVPPERQGLRAARNPVWKNWDVAAVAFRLEDRQLKAGLFQLPPRRTLLVPFIGPGGFVVGLSA
jgi:hypothetical protein